MKKRLCIALFVARDFEKKAKRVESVAMITF